MASQRSLKHEYELYLEDEIEAYKESLPRSALLALGDEAVEALRVLPQTTLSEVVLCEEVDRLIVKRLRLPSYRTWRRRYMLRLADLRRPERWGYGPETPLVRELAASRDGEHVLVAEVEDEGVVLFAAALGCVVTAIGRDAEALGRTVAAAEGAGLGRRVRACVAALDGWMPDAGLRVVVYAADALSRVCGEQRGEVVDALQRATLPGGAHFIRAPQGDVVDARSKGAPWVEALAASYAGWATAVEDGDGVWPTFVARKLGC